MKTSVEIPDLELRDVVKFTKAKTKREAITIAIVDFNQRQRMRQLAATLGTFEDFIKPSELKQLRRGKSWPKAK